MRFNQLRNCLLLAGIAVASPAAGSSARQVSVEQSLALMSLELMNAIERKDRHTLNRLVASDFALRVPGERKVTARNEWIANAVGMDWSRFRYENPVVQVHGNSATVSSRLHFRVAPMPFALDSGVVDSWERRGDRWQITGRYLGQSDFQERVAFGLGVLAALGVAAVAYAITWLVRRSRRRAR